MAKMPGGGLLGGMDFGTWQHAGMPVKPAPAPDLSQFGRGGDMQSLLAYLMQQQGGGNNGGGGQFSGFGGGGFGEVDHAFKFRGIRRESRGGQVE